MNADIFSEWLRRQGHTVKRTASSYWFDQGPRVYQAFPYHWVIEPEEDELRSLLCQNRTLGLRYSTPLSATQGMLSYHVVCEGSGHDLASLPRKVRHDIRKGVEYADVERISLSRLAAEGWDLRFQTISRQGREAAENQAWWRRLCSAAESLPGFDAWGVLHNGELVSSLLAFFCGDCYTLLYQQSATQHLRHGVNNLLFFVAINEALNCEGISRAFIALHSLDAPPEIDKFKFRMGYTAKPVRQRVVFHPWLSPMFNSASHAAVRQLQRWQPQNPMLAKTEGMMRFYLEGKRPLAQQTWPEALRNSSDADIIT